MTNCIEMMRKQRLARIGRVSRLYHSGKSPEEIAFTIKRPVKEVEDLIEIIKEADEIKKNGFKKD